MAAYYNEIDPFAAAWLRELIKAGLIADGEVDTRSIADVRADDVRGFRQCHFFAGIGGWSYALRLAGWPDERAAWTGSCPCQPFSSAGKGDGADDPRHLWPTWFRLICECRPVVVFGEQVASADGLGWFDRVSTDLEDAGYAVGAADLCAASVGASHIRQRLWFVADNISIGRQWWPHTSKPACQNQTERREGLSDIECGGDSGDMGNTNRASATRHRTNSGAGAASEGVRGRPGDTGELGNARSQGLAQQRGERGAPCEQSGTHTRQAVERAGTSVDWSACDWLPCLDRKARPVEPGTFPLAHGVPARVGRLRGYGNAIVPQVAAAFIEAYLDCGR